MKGSSASTAASPSTESSHHFSKRISRGVRLLIEFESLPFGSPDQPLHPLDTSAGNGTTIRGCWLHGALDIVTANGSVGDASILLGNGAGEFVEQRYLVGGWADDLVIDDLDGDGVLDLITAHPVGASVAAVLGQGTASERQSIVLRPQPEDSAAFALNERNILGEGGNFQPSTCLPETHLADLIHNPTGKGSSSRT